MCNPTHGLLKPLEYSSTGMRNTIGQLVLGAIPRYFNDGNCISQILLLKNDLRKEKEKFVFWGLKSKKVCIHFVVVENLGARRHMELAFEKIGTAKQSLPPYTLPYKNLTCCCRTITAHSIYHTLPHNTISHNTSLMKYSIPFCTQLCPDLPSKDSCPKWAERMEKFVALLIPTGAKLVTHH